MTDGSCPSGSRKPFSAWWAISGPQVTRPQKVEGQWRHGGIAYRDNLVKIIVDMLDTVGNRKWMKTLKAGWKSRLKQFELWMVSYRTEID